ncbi:MAG: hypothetical protein WCR48_04125, partial [Bacteroidales bacterium]
MQDQLEASNAAVCRLTLTIRNMESSFKATVANLNATIANPENLLKERDAIFYSLACSCRLHRINFFEYLSDVLNRVAEMPNGAPPD